MIQQFKVKPSSALAVCIVIAHAFTIISVLCFDVAIIVRASVALLLMISLAWNLYKWSHNHYFIKYESAYTRWSMSLDARRWQQYETVSIAYLNGAFVWIILSSPSRVSRAAIIGVDSMSAERFLQLRRCILCPDILDY